MAKKSFKGGLDSLLASAGIKKKSEIDIEKVEKKGSSKKDISDDEKYWMALKIEDLKQELALWRTGKLTISEFQKSLNEHGLSFNSEENKIIEK